jgi:hypothetical protein
VKLCPHYVWGVCPAGTKDSICNEGGKYKRCGIYKKNTKQEHKEKK